MQSIVLECAVKCFFVKIVIVSNVLSASHVSINAAKFKITFLLTRLMPLKEPYNFPSTATYAGAFEAHEAHTGTRAESYL